MPLCGNHMRLKYNKYLSLQHNHELFLKLFSRFNYNILCMCSKSHEYTQFHAPFVNGKVIFLQKFTCKR